MLVAGDVPGGPPHSAIRMHRLSDEDIAKSACVRRVVQVEILETIHVLEIEKERTLAAIDLERDVVLSSVSKARRFKVGNGTVLKTSNPRYRIVYR